MARYRWRFGSPGQVAGAASLCAVLMAPRAAFGGDACRIEPSLLFAYPSVDTETTLPRNAQPLFVVAKTIWRTTFGWPGERPLPGLDGTPFDRFRVDVGDRLTPGSHQAVLELTPEPGAALDLEPYLLRFSVSDVVAPPPDATSRVAITRMFRFRRWVGGILRSDLEAADAAETQPNDCSAEVGIQYGCRSLGPPSRIGDYRVELEAEGPALGYAINDRYFLPAHCRSAFLDDDAPYRIRVVTETGLGTESQYLGEVENVISSEPDPLAPPEDRPLLACSTSTRSGSTEPAGVLGAALLLSLAARRVGAARRAAGF